MRGEIKRKRKYLKTQEDPSDIMHGGGSVFAYAYNRVEIWDTSVLNHIKIQNCETQCKYKSSKKQKQNWYNFTPDVKKCMGLWDLPSFKPKETLSNSFFFFHLSHSFSLHILKSSFRKFD